MPSTRSRSVLLLTATAALTLAAPSHANPRLEALRARIQARRAAAADAPVEWLAAPPDGAFHVPVACGEDGRPVGRLRGRASHPHPCAGGEGFWDATAQIPAGWTFLRDCRPVTGSDRDPVKGCPDGFMGFHHPGDSWAAVPPSFVGLRATPGGDVAYHQGLKLTAKAFSLVPESRPTQEDWGMPPAPRIDATRAFVLSPLKEGKTAGGFYLGQVSDGLAHGFGMGVFPSGFAFVGMHEAGFTKGWNLNLSRRKAKDGKSDSGYRTLYGEFEDGLPVVGAQTFWYPFSASEPSHGELMYYAGHFDEKAQVHGPGVLRRWDRRIAVRENLFQIGLFANNQLWDGEEVRGLTHGRVRNKVEGGKREVVSRWMQVGDIGLGVLFYNRGELHMIASQDGEFARDESNELYRKTGVYEVPERVEEADQKRLGQKGTALMKELARAEAAEQQRRAEQRKKASRSWTSFFARGSSSGSSGYSSGYNSASRHSSPARFDRKNYDRYLNRAINGQVSGGYSSGQRY